jgi:16S rRNA G966 N2-methylase RsmD
MGYCAIILENLTELEAQCLQIANAAASSSRPTQAGSPEGKIGFAQEPAATQHEGEQERKTATGAVGATSSLVDTSASTLAAASIAWSIASSWKNTLEGVCAMEKTSTTETESKTTTDWRTLNCCLSQITPVSIIQACSLPGGFGANASTAAQIFNASLASLQSTLTLSAIEPATWQALDGSLAEAVKPNVDPVIVARKPLKGTVAANVLKYGTGGLNVDGCRVEHNGRRSPNAGDGTVHRTTVNTYGKATSGDTFDVNQHRWPANVIHDGSDEVIELFPNSGKGNGGKPYNYKGKEYNNKDTSMFNGDKPNAPSNFNDSGSAARYFKACPDDDLEDREIRRLFYCAKASKRDRDEGLEWFEVIISSSQLNKELSWENEERLAVLRVVMEASRPRVIDASGVPSKSVSEWNMWLSGSESMDPCRLTTTYTTETATSLTTESKILNCFLNLLTSESMEGANFVEVFGGSPVESVEHGIQQITITSAKTESALGVEPAVLRTQLKISVNARRNNHVTVKPTALMRYLCRLVTPPGGIVLDPFMGSGSTGKAAMLEGFQFIGIEREDEYVKIAQARIEYAIATKESQDTLTETTTSDPRQLSIDDI